VDGTLSQVHNYDGIACYITLQIRDTTRNAKKCTSVKSSLANEVAIEMQNKF